MYRVKPAHKSFLSLILVLSLILCTLSGCGNKSEHLEVTYEDNNNGNIVEWEDATDNNTTTWDNVMIASWSDIDEYSEWVYSTILFEDISDGMPLIERKVFDFQSKG